jgi:glycosyltransferase involved in cell wall biosynthesis
MPSYTACVMTSAHPAGDTRIYHKQCRSLSRAGFDVTLIAPHSGQQAVEDGVRIRGVHQHSNRFWRMINTTRAIYREALAVNADVYHFHDPELIPVGLLLRARGKRVLYDIHEDLPRTLSYKSYVRPWMRKPLEKMIDVGERLATRFFSGLIVANPSSVPRFRESAPLAVVQNFPLMHEFASIAASDDFAPREFVTYVGQRITRARGAEEMVQAIGLVPEHVPLRLKLVGRIEPPELLSSLQQMPGWKRVNYEGTLGRSGVVSAVRSSLAGLVVLHPEPNYVTAQPVKLFEYMGAGIPVIASDFPILRSIVEGAGCGIVVDPTDPLEIAKAILHLHNNRADARAMGECGRRAIEARYNWASEERELLRMYHRLCSQASA